MLETPFAGSIVAPRASLAIGTAASRTHRGSIRGFFYFTATEVRKAVAPSP